MRLQSSQTPAKHTCMKRRLRQLRPLSPVLLAWSVQQHLSTLTLLNSGATHNRSLPSLRVDQVPSLNGGQHMGQVRGHLQVRKRDLEVFDILQQAWDLLRLPVLALGLALGWAKLLNISPPNSDPSLLKVVQIWLLQVALPTRACKLQFRASTLRLKAL